MTLEPLVVEYGIACMPEESMLKNSERWLGLGGLVRAQERLWAQEPLKVYIGRSSTALLGSGRLSSQQCQCQSLHLA